MILKITDIDGLGIADSLSEKLERVADVLNSSGKTITQALLHTTRNHFRTIYPASSHYDPDKVTEGNFQGSTGSINIDVAGITRALHDLDIRPKFRKHLTIPMHSSAYGKKATDFNDLFCITKKDGSKFLARDDGSKLVFMYRLSKGVHQHQDKRLLPTAEVYRDNIMARISARLQSI